MQPLALGLLLSLGDETFSSDESKQPCRLLVSRSFCKCCPTGNCLQSASSTYVPGLIYFLFLSPHSRQVYLDLCADFHRFCPRRCSRSRPVVLDITCVP